MCSYRSVYKYIKKWMYWYVQLHVYTSACIQVHVQVSRGLYMQVGCVQVYTGACTGVYRCMYRCVAGLVHTGRVCT